MTRSRVRRIAVALAPPLLFSVACGGSTTTTTSSGIPAACDVLTRDLVTPVAGSDAVQHRTDPGLDTYPNHCTFTSSTATVQIVIADWSQIGYPAGQLVPGIGDEAHVAPGGILYARKGARGLMVAVTFLPGTDPGAKVAAEKSVAPKLLAKL
ncbi:hypothetical protein [Nocardia sp. alder85J]|uniref:hypothetical protein n=1 Tax=Nocardia sp. alder85J TaxID=2862949 RepID=UPI001CD29987|nr:hypothetical protein [Nocardia sp. alder85J]MCX4091485.1 hypothetical protein [Nocardia sp. alder85J]